MVIEMFLQAVAGRDDPRLRRLERGRRARRHRAQLAAAGRRRRRHPGRVRPLVRRARPASRNCGATPLDDGSAEVVEYTLSWTEDGVPHAAHHMHLLRVRDDRIVADTVFCGGRWPAALLAEMESAND